MYPQSSSALQFFEAVCRRADLDLELSSLVRSMRNELRQLALKVASESLRSGMLDGAKTWNQEQRRTARPVELVGIGEKGVSLCGDLPCALSAIRDACLPRGAARLP